MRFSSVVWMSLLVVGAGCGESKGPAATARPKAWATPIQKPGLPNFHKIDDGLYRGAQPTERRRLV